MNEMTRARVSLGHPSIISLTAATSPSRLTTCQESPVVAEGIDHPSQQDPSDECLVEYLLSGYLLGGLQRRYELLNFVPMDLNETGQLSRVTADLRKKNPKFQLT